MDSQQRHKIASIIFIIFLMAVLFFFGKGSEDFSWPKGRIEIDGGYREVMGTFARVVAVAMEEEKGRECVEAGFEVIEQVDNSMSDYKSDSELSMVNREAFEKDVKISAELFDVLRKSVEYSRKTAGAFDVTVGPLVDLFRLAEEEGFTPTEEQIAGAKEKVGYEKLKLDEQNMTVKFAVEGMRIDLGGIAKGYSIDKAIKIMQKCGAIGAMVDIGGDIKCFGAPPTGKKFWKIGLQEPGDMKEGVAEGELSLVLSLTDAAIATSGDYRRYVLLDGKKYSHIIDARTGAGSEGLSSVTIISDDAIDADALATAVSVMGTEKGLELIESLENTEAILISSKDKAKLITTSGAEKYIKP